jgi:hypothetical protein
MGVAQDGPRQLGANAPGRPHEALDRRDDARVSVGREGTDCVLGCVGHLALLVFREAWHEPPRDAPRQLGVPTLASEKLAVPSEKLAVPSEKLGLPREEIALREGARGSKLVDTGPRAEKIAVRSAELTLLAREIEVSRVERACPEEKICRARVDVGHAMDTLGWKRCEIPSRHLEHG